MGGPLEPDLKWSPMQTCIRIRFILYADPKQFFLTVMLPVTNLASTVGRSWGINRPSEMSTLTIWGTSSSLLHTTGKWFHSVLIFLETAMFNLNTIYYSDISSYGTQRQGTWSPDSPTRRWPSAPSSTRTMISSTWLWPAPAPTRLSAGTSAQEILFR